MKIPALFKWLPFFLPLLFLFPALMTMPRSGLSLLGSTEVQQLKTVFIGIFLEALPFVLLGVLISSLLQIFVKEEWVRRLTPKHPVPGVLFASLRRPVRLPARDDPSGLRVRHDSCRAPAHVKRHAGLCRDHLSSQRTDSESGGACRDDDGISLASRDHDRTYGTSLHDCGHHRLACVCFCEE